MQLVEIAYFTDDVSIMASFYSGLLGQSAEYQTGDMAIFRLGATKIFIHKTYSPAPGELPPENHIAFAVTDVDGASVALSALGYETEVAPRNYYWGRSAYLRNPDGHLIELTQDGA